MKPEKYFKDIKRIEDVLTSEGNKLLFYHADADGVCSGVLLARYFEGFEVQSRKGPSIDSMFLNFLVEKKPDVIVFVDLPVDQEYKKLASLIKKNTKLKIIIIDHHIYEKELNTKNIIHVNPKIQEDIYLPASYLVYKMIELMDKDVKDDIWISSIGIIGDYGIECTDVLEETRKEYPELLGKDIFKSKLSTAADMINAATTLHGFKGIDEVFENLLKAHIYYDFGENSKFVKWNDEVNKEIDKMMEIFEKESKKKSEIVEIHKDIGLVMYQMETELSLSSAVSTRLTKKYKNEVLLIIRKIKDEGYKISARCQSGRIDVATLVKNATKGIGNGGGHVKAAGAFTTDLGIFKSRVIRELKK